MKGYNKVIVCGNVGGDPNVRTFDNGGKKVDFSVATSEGGYTTSQGVEVPEITHWHRIVVGGRLAEMASQYIHKGKEVLIEGKLTYREYTNKDGNKVSVTEILANEIKLLGSKNDNADTQDAVKVQVNTKNGNPTSLHDIAEKMVNQSLFGNDLPF